jgi:CDP-diacylglycerol--serine O-phosphatidyltransferase
MSEVRNRMTTTTTTTKMANGNKSVMGDEDGQIRDSGHLSMMRTLLFADYITLLNGFCGVMSIFNSVKYGATGDSTYAVRAMWFIPFGLFFDFMDGRVARWRDKSSLMGQELDSLADLISFGVAPATIGFSLGLQTAMDSVVLIYFVLCGLTRLARFNVTVANIPKDEGGKSKYFEGTPIPTTLAIVGLMFYFHHQGWVQDDLIGGLWFEDSPGLSIHPVVLVYALSGCGMISKSLKVPKP